MKENFESQTLKKGMAQNSMNSSTRYCAGNPGFFCAPFFFTWEYGFLNYVCAQDSGSSMFVWETGKVPCFAANRCA
jgi:hypothetical protein